MASAIAQEFYEQLGPWYQADLATPGQPLLDLCEAFIGGLQVIEEVIRDDDEGNIGWSAVLDPDRAADLPGNARAWLNWLKNFVGLVSTDTTLLTDDQLRDMIKQQPRQARGTPQAMIDAAKVTLTGTKSVFLQERFTSAYTLKLSTYTTETPDVAALTRAVIGQKPAGIVLTLAQITGGDYATVGSTHTNYNDIAATYINYAEIPIDPDK